MKVSADQLHLVQCLCCSGLPCQRPDTINRPRFNCRRGICATSARELRKSPQFLATFAGSPPVIINRLATVYRRHGAHSCGSREHNACTGQSHPEKLLFRVSVRVPTLLLIPAQTFVLWVGLAGMKRHLIKQGDGERWDLVVSHHHWVVEYRGSVVHQFLSLSHFERSRAGMRLANELWVAIARAINS